jgi:hypothetical protein
MKVRSDDRRMEHEDPATSDEIPEHPESLWARGPRPSRIESGNVISLIP